MSRNHRQGSKYLGAALLLLFVATGAQAQSRLADFEKRILASHNAERAANGLAPMQWSPALAANAAKWAAHLAVLDDIEHDHSLDVEGENLWRGSKDAYTPEDMVTLWIDEKKAYKPGVIPNVSITGEFEDVGHYTQVMWRTTGLVGCALSLAKDDEVLVCRYMEGGNVVDEKAF